MIRRLGLADDGAGREEFERDRMIERQVFAAVHFAHPAAPEQCDEALASGDNGTGRQTAR